MPHLILPHQLIATAPAAMEEVNIMVLMPPNLKLEAPTSIEVLGETVKPIHIMKPALHTAREVRAGTATRRSINPTLATFVTTSMLT